MTSPRFSKVPSGCRVENTHGECACVLRCVQLFASPWTVANQAPPSKGLLRQEYGEGCHFLLQEIFPTQEVNLYWQVDSVPLYHLGGSKVSVLVYCCSNKSPKT